MNIIHITEGSIRLEGELILPPSAKSVVLFAHRGGNSRFSPRNTYVAEMLQQQGITTLLFDLLTREEDRGYEMSFDIIPLACRRFVGVYSGKSCRRSFT